MGNHDKTENTGKNPLILAVETSSRIGSVALAAGGELLDELTFSSPMQHSAEILPAIRDLLARHHQAPQAIDQIHIAVGPGSFTGLRIAVAMAKTMHLARGTRIVTVDSLDVVAANLSDTPGATDDFEPHRSAPTLERIAALFDAKRGQFYVSIYARLRPEADASQGAADEAPGYRIPAPGGAIWRKVLPDSLMTAREITDGFAGTDPLGILGDGLLYHRDEFAHENTIILPERYWSPRAANVHRLGWQKATAGLFADPLALTPFYLRGPQVTLRRQP